MPKLEHFVLGHAPLTAEEWFLKRFSDLLDDKDLNKTTFAEITGIFTRDRMNVIFTKNGKVTLDELVSIADFFDVSVSYLIGEEDNNKDIESLLQKYTSFPPSMLKRITSWSKLSRSKWKKNLKTSRPSTLGKQKDSSIDWITSSNGFAKAQKRAEALNEKRPTEDKLEPYLPLPPLIDVLGSVSKKRKVQDPYEVIVAGLEILFTESEDIEDIKSITETTLYKLSKFLTEKKIRNTHYLTTEELKLLEDIFIENENVFDTEIELLSEQLVQYQNHFEIALDILSEIKEQEDVNELYEHDRLNSVIVGLKNLRNTHITNSFDK